MNKVRATVSMKTTQIQVANEGLGAEHETRYSKTQGITHTS